MSKQKRPAPPAGISPAPLAGSEPETGNSASADIEAIELARLEKILLSPDMQDGAPEFRNPGGIVPRRRKPKRMVPPALSQGDVSGEGEGS
jgi:hypothetical protein